MPANEIRRHVRIVAFVGWHRHASTGNSTSTAVAYHHSSRTATFAGSGVGGSGCIIAACTCGYFLGAAAAFLGKVVMAATRGCAGVITTIVIGQGGFSGGGRGLFSPLVSQGVVQRFHLGRGQFHVALAVLVSDGRVEKRLRFQGPV